MMLSPYITVNSIIKLNFPIGGGLVESGLASESKSYWFDTPTAAIWCENCVLRHTHGVTSHSKKNH